MGPVGVRLRSELRARWRAWLVLAVLIGGFGGVVLGVAAGARRTATAYPRFIEASRGSDALVGAYRYGADDYYRALDRDPAVAEFGKLASLPIFPLGRDGQPQQIAGNVVTPVDGKLHYTIDRPRILAGRLPRADRPNEALVNEVAADRFHAHVGSRIPMALMRYDETNPEGEPLSVTPIGDVVVVGIGRFTSEVVPTEKFDVVEIVLMGPATWRAYGRGATLNWDGVYVRLQPGTSVAAFSARAKALAQEHAEAVGGDVLISDNVDRDRHVNRAIRPQAAALGLFAGMAGLAGFFVLGQALSRQLGDDATEVPILRTLGMTRAQLVRLTLLRTALIAGAGAALAVGVAIALSPLFPVGVARQAEAHTGVEVNLGLLAAGAAAILVLLVARAAVPAWRLAGVAAGVQGTAALDAGRSSTLARRVGSTSLPATASSGIRMALEPGRGRTAVPVRATLVGAVVGLGAVAATMVFGTNLDRVVATPHLYGRTFDLMADGSFGPMPRQPVEKIVRTHPSITGWSGGFYADATVAGRAVPAVGIDGPLRPVVVEGRAPRTDDEVVLGTLTLKQIHARLGQRVDVALGAASRSMLVVGRGVFPAFGRGTFAQTGLGEGALMTGDAVQPPDDPDSGMPPAGTWFNFYLFDMKPGTAAAEVAAIKRELTPLCPGDQNCRILSGDEVAAEARPAEIATLGKVRWTPVVLAGLLAALAVATVGLTLVTSIRRRRRDFALLKTMGFRRRQVSATVAWQATTFAAAAAIVGIPAGVALGRVLWLALADQLGIVPSVATPAVALVVAVPVTILLANALAVIPGWLAGRVRPAVALRAE
jgi:ABC-type antimicrobial peptide transport system permease subunit